MQQETGRAVVAAYADYRNRAADCAHLCGCRRASILADTTLGIAHASGWTMAALGDLVGVSYARIQQRIAAYRKQAGL